MAGAPQTTVLDQIVASGRSLYARTFPLHALRASMAGERIRLHLLSPIYFPAISWSDRGMSRSREIS